MTIEDFKKKYDLVEMDDIYESHQQQLELLTEQKIPEFNTPQEALEYFGDMSFEEWENNVKEKYGL